MKFNARPLAIKQINSFLRLNSNISYSQFMNLVTISGVIVNRKILAELAVNEPKTLMSIIEVVSNNKESLAR